MARSEHGGTCRDLLAVQARPPELCASEQHFCATHVLELGLSPADVAIQLGHTAGGALVMSTYGHPSEDAARERLKRAFATNVSLFRSVDLGSQAGSGGA